VVERTVTVPNALGLHARPAAQLVRLANGFDAEIVLAKAEMSVNGKSIMGVMMLAAECGSTLRIEANGPDEEAAVQAIAAMITDGFGEG